MSRLANNPKRSYRSWLWKMPLGVFLVLIIGLVVAVLNIDALTRVLAHRTLQARLSQGGKLKDVHVRLGQGRIEVRGLVFNAPREFGETPLFSAGTIVLDVAPSSLFGDRVIVEEVLLKDVDLVLVRDGQRRWNLTQLLMPVEAGASEKPAEGGPAALPQIQANSIRLAGVRVHVIDQASRTPWHAELKFELSFDDLMLGDVRKREVRIGRLDAVLKDLAADQPGGFGKKKLIELARLALLSRNVNLAASKIVVEQIQIEHLVSRLIVHKDGMSNVTALRLALFGSTGSSEENGPQSAEEKTRSSGTAGKALPGFRLEQLAMTDGALYYRNSALTDEPLVFPMNHIQLKVNHLILFHAGEEAEPARADLSFELNQPGNLPRAYFGAVAEIGPVGGQTPPVNAQARLTGFKLDTLGSLIPPGTKSSLGASGFDARLEMAMNPKAIEMSASLLTDRRIKYDLLRVQGPVKDPEIKMGSILAGRFDSEVSPTVQEVEGTVVELMVVRQHEHDQSGHVDGGRRWFGRVVVGTADDGVRQRGDEEQGGRGDEAKQMRVTRGMGAHGCVLAESLGFRLCRSLSCR